MIKLPKFGSLKLLCLGLLLVFVLMQPVFGDTTWVTPPENFQNIQIGAVYEAAGTTETSVHPNEDSLNLFPSNIEDTYEIIHDPDVKEVKEKFYVEFTIKSSAQAGPNNLIVQDGSDAVVKLNKNDTFIDFGKTDLYSGNPKYFINTDGLNDFFSSTFDDNLYTYIRFDNVKMYYGDDDVAGYSLSDTTGEGNPLTFASSLASPINTIISIKNGNNSDALPILEGQKITKIKFKITYPPLMIFKGIDNKYGIKLFGLDCPDTIYAIFYIIKTGEAGTKINHISMSKTNYVGGFIYKYTSDTGVVHMIPSNLSDPQSYTYKCYYEYKWPSDTRYSKNPIILTKDSSINEDKNFQVFFSLQQSNMEDGKPTEAPARE
jgi:hypothetical protein